MPCCTHTCNPAAPTLAWNILCGHGIKRSGKAAVISVLSLQAPACSPGLLLGEATPSPCRWSVTPLRATCDPGAVPWLHTHSCWAQSALFQGLILNPCFSHPPQTCSSFFICWYFFPSPLSPIACFAFQADKLFYLCQHLPIHSSCRRDPTCLSSSLVPCYFTQIKQLTHSLQSPLFLVCSMFSGKQIRQDKIVLQPAHRGCRHREILHKVLDCSQCLPWQSFGSLILATMTFELEIQ